MMADAFWACGRQTFPYLIMEGLSVTLVRFAGFLRKLDWIVSFSSLIVCAQCVSRDWLAIEKDCLYRVIR
jgi:hypothetical protein